MNQKSMKMTMYHHIGIVHNADFEITKLISMMEYVRYVVIKNLQTIKMLRIFISLFLSILQHNPEIIVQGYCFSIYHVFFIDF